MLTRRKGALDRSVVAAFRFVPILLAAASLPLLLWVVMVALAEPTPYIDAFDRLAVPPSWQLAHEEVQAPGVGACVTGVGNCPAVTRYYRVPFSDPTLRADAVDALIRSAGFVPDLSAGGGLGNMTATRAADHLSLSLAVGQDAFFRGSRHYEIDPDGGTIIRIIIEPAR